jgi:hypothetical protein
MSTHFTLLHNKDVGVMISAFFISLVVPFSNIFNFSIQIKLIYWIKMGGSTLLEIRT